MKFLAVLLTCLLAASLLVVFVAGEEVAEEAASSSSESVSSSSEEAIAESSSGSEEIVRPDSQSSGVSSGEEDEASGESGSGAVVEEPAEASQPETAAPGGERRTVVPLLHPSDIHRESVHVAAMDRNQLSQVVTIEIRRADSEEPMSHRTIVECLELMGRNDWQLFREIGRITDVLSSSIFLVIVRPTPRILDGTILQLSFFARAEMGLIDGLDLFSAIENVNNVVFHEDSEFELGASYRGLPSDLEQLTIKASARRDIKQPGWRANMGLFAAIIGVAGVCLIALTVGLLVVKSRARSQQIDDQPMMKLDEGGFSTFEMRSPFTDAEIKSSENVRL